MRNRRFGVELEFSSNMQGANGVGRAFHEVGLGHWIPRHSVWSYSLGRYHDQYYIGHDGSELELRSPILEGVAGLNELKLAVKTLNRLGCYTTPQDGLHIHHDAPEFVANNELIVKLLKSWVANQDHISKFIIPRRANRSGAPCAVIQQNQLDSYIENSGRYAWDGAIYGYLPRGSINLQALPEHGSIEFRYMEGTLDWGVIESWLRFGQSFLDGVLKRKNPIARAENPVVLLNRLRASKNAKTILTSKAVTHYGVGVLA